MVVNYIINNALVTLVNVAHLMLYYKVRKNIPLLVLGVALLTVAMPMPGYYYGAGTDLYWALLIVPYSIVCALVLQHTILLASFRQALFGVYAVATFGNLMQVAVILLLKNVFVSSDGDFSVLFGRIVQSGLCLASFPILYLCVRKPFQITIAVIKTTKSYMAVVAPLLYHLIVHSVMFAVFTYDGGWIVLLGLATIAASAAFYWSIYYSTFLAWNNQYLRTVLDSSQNLLPYYRFYDQELEKMESKVRTLRHDLRHMAGSMAQAAKAGDARQLADLAGKVTQFDGGGEPYILSQNRTINAVVSFYFSIAAPKGVACSADLKVPEEIPLSELELVTLVGNALENGVKAASVLETDGRLTISAKIVSNCLAVKVVNNFQPGNVQEGEGLGLRSMRTLCEEHSGMFKTEVEGDEFRLTAIVGLNGAKGRERRSGKTP